MPGCAQSTLTRTGLDTSCDALLTEVACKAAGVTIIVIASVADLDAVEVSVDDDEEEAKETEGAGTLDKLSIAVCGAVKVDVDPLSRTDTEDMRKEL